MSLTGGEPFLEFDKLLFLLNLIEKDAAFHWAGILTNGTLIDASKVSALKAYSKLCEVQVSLDGADAITHDQTRGCGAFEKALSGLQLLNGAGFVTSIMFTLTRQNRHSVCSMIDLADGIGVDAITIERYTPSGNFESDGLVLSSGELKESFTTILEKKKALEASLSKLRIRTSRPLWHLVDPELGGSCPVGYSSLCIMPDATVYPCRRLPISLGNLLRDGIFKIWYKSNVLWDIRRKDKLKGKCGHCGDVGRCGGCRAAAYAYSHDHLGEDPLCWK